MCGSQQWKNGVCWNCNCSSRNGFKCNYMSCSFFNYNFYCWVIKAFLCSCVAIHDYQAPWYAFLFLACIPCDHQWLCACWRFSVGTAQQAFMLANMSMCSCECFLLTTHTAPPLASSPPTVDLCMTASFLWWWLVKQPGDRWEQLFSWFFVGYWLFPELEYLRIASQTKMKLEGFISY